MSDKKINMPEEFVLERITLKRTEKQFAEERLKVFHKNMDHLKEFMPFIKSSYSIDDELMHIARCSKNWDCRKIYDFSIFENETKKYIGSISIMVNNSSRIEYSFGYWLAKSAEGKGYISEAVQALTCYLQDKLKANRVVISCHFENLKSAKVAERNGFLFEYKSFALDRGDDAYFFVNLLNEEKRNELQSLQDNLKSVYNINI